MVHYRSTSALIRINCWLIWDLNLIDSILINFHSSISGRRREVQGSGNHRSAHQAARDWWKQDQDPRTRSSVRPEGAGSFVHEDWPHRGCYPHPLGLHPQEGRSPWSSFVDTRYATTTLLGTFLLCHFSWINDSNVPKLMAFFDRRGISNLLQITFRPSFRIQML